MLKRLFCSELRSVLDKIAVDVGKLVFQRHIWYALERSLQFNFICFIS